MKDSVPKIGQYYQDVIIKDVWRITGEFNNHRWLSVCVDGGNDKNYQPGAKESWNFVDNYWELVEYKSENFKSLYDKLCG